MALPFNEKKALLQLHTNGGDVSRVAMRSKRALSLLARMQDKGLIEFDPFEGQATLTDAGRAAIGEPPI